MITRPSGDVTESVRGLLGAQAKTDEDFAPLLAVVEEECPCAWGSFDCNLCLICWLTCSKCSMSN